MSPTDPIIVSLIKSLLVSQGTVVGGTNSSAIKIEAAIKQISTEGSHPQVEEGLAVAAQQVLDGHSPEVSELEKWILYQYDFSGLTSYLTEGGTLTHAKIIRNIDMTNSQHYENCYEEVKELTKLKQDCSSTEEIEAAELAVKSKLPGKRIKYIHWIGSKPSKEEIASIKLANTNILSANGS
tara:strand:- start:232 stop:777 length:546 start_codon:yes stop_codon:yes gene_type:complete